MTGDQRLRLLPSVDRVVRAVLGGTEATSPPRAEVVRAAREALTLLRQSLGRGAGGGRGSGGGLGSGPTLARPDLLNLAVAGARRALDAAARPSLRRVVNATGVPLHTNLGRARLAPEAVLAAVGAAGHVNLELSLADGERRSRQEHVRGLLVRLTGAEDAVVVNNNAAAVWLVLRNVARGGSVIISRGELVEIGESFRLPDIMAEARASLVEVGTTNRTTADDYRRALARLKEAAAPATAVVLVHPSNYRVVGFASRPSRREVAALAAEAGVPVVEDLGSGCLLDLGPWGLAGEPTPREALADGVDVVTFSGDKLLGGPQCGVIAGKAAFVAALRQDPVLRCLRPEKLTLAALEATLKLYADPATATARVPALRALTEPAPVVRRRAARALRVMKVLVKTRLQDASPGAALAPGATFTLRPTTTEAGGGGLPGTELESWAVSVSHPAVSPDELWRHLAAAEPPVVARRHRDALLLDFRSVTDDEVPILARIIAGTLVAVDAPATAGPPAAAGAPGTAGAPALLPPPRREVLPRDRTPQTRRPFGAA